MFKNIAAAAAAAGHGDSSKSKREISLLFRQVRKKTFYVQSVSLKEQRERVQYQGEGKL